MPEVIDIGRARSSAMSDELYELLVSHFHPDDYILRDYIVGLSEFQPTKELLDNLEISTRIEIESYETYLLIRSTLFSYFDYKNDNSIAAAVQNQMGENWIKLFYFLNKDISSKTTKSSKEIVRINNFRATPDSEPIDYYYCLQSELEEMKQQMLRQFNSSIKYF